LSVEQSAETAASRSAQGSSGAPTRKSLLSGQGWPGLTRIGPF